MEIAKLAATATMSSREIAELAEARHNDVCATIDRLFDKGLLRSNRKTRIEATGGRPITVYDLNERDTYLVIAGYSDEIRARIIDRWQALETAPPAIPLPESYIQALECLLVSKKAEQAAIEQRDEAIRTKAQIGNSREATAMATASAAKREAARLKEALGASARHATVRAVHGVTKTEYQWLPMRHWCKREQIAPVAVVDPLYGEVKAWPAGAWLDCHQVDLGKLFGGAA